MMDSSSGCAMGIFKEGPLEEHRTKATVGGRGAC